MTLYALTIFVSAFLLFQVQPLIGKFVLPWFGSSPAVWTVAMLFFQVALLAGYAYAHLIASRLPGRVQAGVHGALLVAALLLLPITPAEAWKPAGAESPTLRILLLMTASIGAPFLLLASTSPLLQQWAARTRPDRSPYRLYAVSNAGSLLALLSYPLLFERFVPLRAQALLWSAGFAAAAVLGGLCAWSALRDGMAKSAPVRVGTGAAAPTRAADVAWWLALSACGSTVLLGTMNQLNQDVPPVPFLFVMPLSVYLLTFIVAFDHERWYHRPAFIALLHLGLAGAYLAVYRTNSFELPSLIALYLAALFACCMTCHGELARRKPEPARLTLFYLMVALGGALGGVFVGVLSPRIFRGYWEYEIGLIATYALVAFPLIAALVRRGSRWGRRLGWAAGVGATAGVGLALWLLSTKASAGHAMRPGLALLEQTRNFFGTLHVIEAGIGYPPEHKYELFHGHVKHGFQYQLPEKRGWATAYYGREGGGGLAIEHHPGRAVADREFRIGVVGLGAGTLATYANDAGQVAASRKTVADYMRFYEINPEMVRLAHEYFTFLADAKARGARIDIMVGDARILMERELAHGEPQRFDVLAIDAFSGDAVPMHLLTRECLDIYLAHLAPGGILTFHVSSQYLNLLPVLRALAEDAGRPAYALKRVKDDRGNDSSTWVLVTRNYSFLQAEAVRTVLSGIGQVEPDRVLWTDDFSSLLPLIKAD